MRSLLLLLLLLRPHPTSPVHITALCVLVILLKLTCLGPLSSPVVVLSARAMLPVLPMTHSMLLLLLRLALLLLILLRMLLTQTLPRVCVMHHVRFCRVPLPTPTMWSRGPVQQPLLLVLSIRI